MCVMVSTSAVLAAELVPLEVLAVNPAVVCESGATKSFSLELASEASFSRPALPQTHKHTDT